MDKKIEDLYSADAYFENKKYIDAYTIYLKYAKEDDMYAMNMVWKILFYGYGIKQNIIKAYSWCKKVADKGDAEAQYHYSLYCFKHQQYKDGKDYLDKALKQEYIDAIHHQASNYAFGDFGYEKDMKMAIKLYEKACLLGKKRACIDLYFSNKELVGKMKSARYIGEKIGFLKYFKILARSHHLGGNA